MSFVQLREYQEEALKEIVKALSNGINKQLIVLPTGSGKTILMAAIAKHLNKMTLILAHREELIQQAFEKFKLYWPEADIGICKAERDETDHQIVIGSVQSCSKSKRLASLKDSSFDVLLIDEAHHATAESYQKIINELGFHADQTKLLLGVTATPNRSDNDSLGETFEKITYSRSIATMIKAGYLSPAIGRKILTNFSLQNIKIQNGDFSVGDLAEVVNTSERNTFIAEKYKAYASNRKGVAFCVDVAHCKDLAASFEKVGITSKAIWGEMPTDERRNVLEDLRSGRIQVAMSCGVLTEGFDEPSISCIAMARPTKSQSLYIQCIGRGLRLWPGKQDCLVLDFTDKGHNLDSVMSLSRTIPNTLEIHESSTSEREETERTAKVEIIEECDTEFDLLGYAKFIWVPIGDNEWSLMDDNRNEIIMRSSENGYIADIYINGSKVSIVSNPIPIEYCSGVCEDYARRHLKIAFAEIKAPWMSKQSVATKSQIEFLQKNNAFKNEMNKGEASIEIRKIMALKNKQRRQMENEPITSKQMYALTKFGIETKNMSKFQAMREIAKIKGKRQACTA
jgi:superfamily II DNA or RNA helicase